MNVADVDRAYAEWGANCGPAAVAAILGMALDDVRPVFEAHGFSDKRYTNPTMMFAVLTVLCGRASSKWSMDCDQSCFPKHGLARIQWGGRWMRPGVPVRARYRHTHWVATIDAKHGRGVFDVNAVGSVDGRSDGWTTEQAWESILVPHLTNGIPGADGTWSVTHAIEISKGRRP